MKATVFALITLAIGIALGIGWVQQEFSHEVLPVDVTLTSSGPAANKAVAKIGPKVTIVNGERHDFGTMERNAHGVHDFIVRNDGDATLTLATGEPSCGVCIKVFKVVKEKLEPGERTDAHIEWDIKTGDTEFEQSGPLNTNDQNRPSVRLSLHGHILDTVRTDRSDIHFHDLSANESASGSINIYAFRNDELKIESHNFNNPQLAKFFDVKFVPLTSEELAREAKAKSGLRMQIDTKPGMPYGDFRESISISTNQGADPLTVNIIGNIASDVLLMGPNVIREKSLVSLPAISQKDGKKHTIFLLVKGPHRDETKVEIESYEPTTEFSAKLGEPIRDSAKIIRYPIVIEIPPGATPVTRTEGTYAKINIKTTHPEVKEVNIRVRYLVKE